MLGAPTKKSIRLSRRAALRAAGGSAALLGTLVTTGVGQGTAHAQTGAEPIVGSWSVTAVPVGGGATNRFTDFFTSDGIQVIVPSNPAQSAAIGSWARVGERQYITTNFRYTYDEQRKLTGTFKVRGDLTVNEAGDGFSGLGVSQTYDLDGNLLATGRVTNQGARIAPEPAT